MRGDPSLLRKHSKHKVAHKSKILRRTTWHCKQRTIQNVQKQFNDVLAWSIILCCTRRTIGNDIALRTFTVTINDLHYSRQLELGRVMEKLATMDFVQT